MIADFNIDPNREKIDLSRVKSIESFLDLQQNHLFQQGDNAIIDSGNGNTITLLYVDITDLAAGDFLF